MKALDWVYRSMPVKLVRRRSSHKTKGKRRKPEVPAYRDDLDDNLSELRSMLSDPERLSIGHYRHFRIFDPKERVICEAPFRERGRMPHCAAPIPSGRAEILRFRSA